MRLSIVATAFLASLCLKPALAGLVDSGPITISGQNGTVITGLHIHGSGNCVTITNSTNITIRNSEIGPCGSNGVSISGGSANKIYDNYIHPEASAGGFGSGNSIYANSTSSLAIQGNVIVWGDNDLLLMDITTATVLGNFIFQSRGGSGHRGDPIQVWTAGSITNYNANTNLTITNNYVLNCSNDGLDPAVCASLPSNLRTAYTSNREDTFGIGLSTGVIVQNNFLAGHPNSTSGCSLQSDYATMNFQYLNNRLVDTWGGPDFSQTTNGLADGNKILTSVFPPSGHCTDVAVAWNWAPGNGLSCSGITFQNNIGATHTGGAEGSTYFSGQCGSTTQINNVWGASARTLLSSDSAFLTPPSIPPQPYGCVAISPFTNNPGTPCGGTTQAPPDTTPPSIPTNITATAASATAINIAWTASTDNVGVTGYRVYRGGTQIATVTAGTTYQNTGLTPSTAYSYTVLAYDAAGNLSAQSAPATASTQAPTDTTPPSIPTNVIAAAASATVMNIVWAATTDNVGVTGYRVYRGGTQIATVTAGTTYQNTGLTPSTAYSYTVAAYDAAGNLSAQSAPATASTQALTVISLQVSPGTMSFAATVGGATPAAQQIAVASSGTALNYTALVSGGAWLSATPASGVTPGSVGVSVNPAGLAAGTYTATLAIASSGAANSPQNVAVTLVVSPSGAASLNLSTIRLTLSQGVPGSVGVTSSGAPLAFTASVSGANCSTWLSVSPGSATTPATLTVSLNPAGLAPGQYSGVIAVSAPGATNPTQYVAVTFSQSAVVGATVAADTFVATPLVTGNGAAQWVPGAGVPASGLGVSDDAGLLLSKSGRTGSGVVLDRVDGSTVTELGFDVHSGTECGAASPRFEVVTADNVEHLVGSCDASAVQPSPSEGWTRYRFDVANSTHAVPVIAPNVRVKSIQLVLGGDAAAVVVVDNIVVNGKGVSKQ